MKKTVVKYYESLSEYVRDKSIMNARGFFARDIKTKDDGRKAVTYLKRRT